LAWAGNPNHEFGIGCKQQLAPTSLLRAFTCSRELFQEECEMLDRMMTPFWLRRHHYPNDPYAAYHVRHGIDSPRVDDKGRLVRERAKVGIRVWFCFQS
uniref:Myotubularin phosphatase domain-containing protein n=1 Tax=Heligmosomoides polygyrus TaxID=6339 RepID=A0A183GUM3_HELPZ